MVLILTWPLLCCEGLPVVLESVELDLVGTVKLLGKVQDLVLAGLGGCQFLATFLVRDHLRQRWARQVRVVTILQDTVARSICRLCLMIFTLNQIGGNMDVLRVALGTSSAHLHSSKRLSLVLLRGVTVFSHFLDAIGGDLRLFGLLGFNDVISRDRTGASATTPEVHLLCRSLRT